MNIFGNYNYNNGLNYNFMDLYRKQLDTLFNQQSNYEIRKYESWI